MFMAIRKKRIGLIAVILATGVAIVLIVLNATGAFHNSSNAEESGGLSAGGDRASHYTIERAEVLKVVSEDSLLVKTLPRIFADGKTFEIEERDEYYLATGDEVLAVFEEPNKIVSEGDIILIDRWADKKIDYSHKPWSVECERVEDEVKP
jgi:hypothetical protein